jgi:hypothetical protein
LKGLVKLIRVFVPVKYLALDGYFSRRQTVLMARENDLHLISKLRKDAGLYEKYQGTYSGRGARKKYGEKLNYENLPKKYLKKSETEGDLLTLFYQGIWLSKSFGRELKVVIIKKINLKSGKVGHAILFSSDVELGSRKVDCVLQFEVSNRVQLSRCETTFRVGRFYEPDGNRSRKCSKSIVFDGQFECQIAEKKHRQRCRNK